MLDYQNQDCDLTLEEALDCYYNSFPDTKEIFEDNKDSGTLPVSYTHLTLPTILLV